MGCSFRVAGGCAWLNMNRANLTYYILEEDFAYKSDLKKEID